MASKPPTLTREGLRQGLVQALEPQPWALAAWLGGSAAFGREDELSDLDWVMVVEDGQVEAALALVEATLKALGPLLACHRLPAPTWHGHAQALYAMEALGPEGMLDLVVQQRSAGQRFLEPERHGRPVVLWDREGLTKAQPLDPVAWRAKLLARRAFLAEREPLLRPLVAKALKRGDAGGAMAFYHSMVLAPLVELLRLKHAPWRHDFGLRYLRLDLPPKVVGRLEPLLFVPHLDALGDRLEVAGGWIETLLLLPEEQAIGALRPAPLRRSPTGKLSTQGR